MTLLVDLFAWILSTSLMASVLVLLIIIVKTVLKNKLKPRWAYLLWMLLALRLLLPWTPESSFSVFNMLPFLKYETLKPNKPVVLEPIGEKETQVTTQTIGIEADPTIEIKPAAAKPVSLMQVVSGTWLLGTVFMLGLILAANLRFTSKIAKEPKLSDSRVNTIMETCKDEMNIGRNIELLRTNQVSSPTLLGIFKPQLLMPESSLRALSEEQLRFVFLHELSHVKRNDIAVNWVMSVLLALHWFNPFLWFAYRKIRQDQEIACDELALTRIAPEECKDYARTIIKLLEAFSSPVRLAGVASVSGNKDELKRRIMMITSSNKQSFKWSLLGLAVILLLGSASLTNANMESPAFKTARPFEGMEKAPNKALLVIEEDYTAQIERMNASGEWMNEASIILTLRGMANNKRNQYPNDWSVEMTPELIELMVQNIENAANLEDRKQYLYIVQNWKDKDFSQIEDDLAYLTIRQNIKDIRTDTDADAQVQDPNVDRIMITENEYEQMSQIIRDYQAGKLSDTELKGAQKLLERWVQDAKHGFITDNRGEKAQELLDRITSYDFEGYEIEELAVVWANALKSRDGKPRYEMMSGKAKEKFKQEQISGSGEDWNYTIGGSSPWVVDFQIEMDGMKANITYLTQNSVPEYYNTMETLTFSRENNKLAVDDYQTVYEDKLVEK